MTGDHDNVPLRGDGGLDKCSISVKYLESIYTELKVDLQDFLMDWVGTKEK